MDKTKYDFSHAAVDLGNVKEYVSFIIQGSKFDTSEDKPTPAKQEEYKSDTLAQEVEDFSPESQTGAGLLEQIRSYANRQGLGYSRYTERNVTFMGEQPDTITF